MATYAVLSGDVVSNIIVANTLADAELVTREKCVEYTDANPAYIGWIYDEKNNKFTSPVKSVNVESTSK